MLRIKIFTGPTPAEVETQVNEWLATRPAIGRVVQATPTDVVHAARDGGLQRYSLAVLYEAAEGKPTE